MSDSQYKLRLVIDAENSANAEFLKVQAEVEKLKKQMKELETNIEGMMTSSGSFADRLKKSLSSISFATTIQAAKELWNTFSNISQEIWNRTGAAAAALEPIENGFKRLSMQAGIASDQMLSAMRKASLGTVSDFNLMTAANKAYSLGVVSNTEQMTTLMEIARVKGQAMGRTMNEALDDIVTGLGRGSAMILDNLGIVVNQTEAQKAYAESIGKTVEQLSEREKKQALINAVVAQGKTELEGLGESTLGFSDKQEKLSTTLENIATTFGKSLLPSIGEAYDKINAWLDDHIESIELAVSAIGEMIGNLISTITDSFSQAFSIIGDILHNTVDLFAEGINNIAGYDLEGTTALKGDWSDFFYFFQQGISVILGVVQVAIGYIKGTWEGLKAFVNALVDDIVTVFTGGADGIAQVWSNIVSDVTTNLKKMANAAISVVNWTIEQFNKIPGVDIGKFDLIAITDSGSKSAIGARTKLITEPIKGAKEAGEKVLDGMIDTYEKRVEKLNKTTSSLNIGNKTLDLGASPDPDKKSGSKEKNSNLEKLKKEMEEYAKETKRIQQDVYKAVQKEADNWLANQVKNINELDKEFQKSFDKIQDKIDDTTKNIENLTKNISDLRKKLVELQVEQTQSVAKEYVKAKKEMESLEEQYKGLKEVANGVSREDLKGVGGIGKYDVDLIKKYKDYQDEMKSAYTGLSEEERKAMDEQIAYQERYRGLNNVEKIKEDYRIKKEEVQSELDAKISALNTEQETLRSLKKEQQKLQDEWIKRIDEEVLKWKEMSDKKQAFEKQYMEILEINHQKQVDMTNKLVEQRNAVYRAKMRAMSGGGGGGSSGSRASGGPVYQGNAYLVGEAGPEMFVPATNGKIVKNSDLGGGGGNISVNVNLGGVSINNGSDENALTQKITESIIRELVLYKKGIR